MKHEYRDMGQRRTRPSERRMESRRELLSRSRYNNEDYFLDEDESINTLKGVDPTTLSEGKIGRGNATVTVGGRQSQAARRNGNRIQEKHNMDRVYGREMRSRRAPGSRRKKARRGSLIKRLLIALLFSGIIFLSWNFLKPYIGNKYWTVAVFGLDSRDGRLGKGALSDVIMLASINRRDGSVRLCSVYRDCYTQVDENGKYHKLNEAYFLGGHEQAISALERNLDLKIDDYVSFNWSAVAKAITALGGVELEITDSEFKFINAFITETVDSTGLGSVQLTQPGMNHLDGVQAVAYGRLRLMDTDFNRTARQRKVLGLALDKAKQARTRTLMDVARYVFPEISTSLGLDDIVTLAANVRKYEIEDSQGFPFARTTRKIKKMDCVVPGTLATNVVKLHEYLYGAEDYRPSEMVQSISNHIKELSGVGELDNAEPIRLGGAGSGEGTTKQTAEVKNKKEAMEEKKEELASMDMPRGTEEEAVAAIEDGESPESIDGIENTDDITEAIEDSREQPYADDALSGTVEDGSSAVLADESSRERPTAPGGESALPGEEDASHGPGIL